MHVFPIYLSIAESYVEIKLGIRISVSSLTFLSGIYGTNISHVDLLDQLCYVLDYCLQTWLTCTSRKKEIMYLGIAVNDERHRCALLSFWFFFLDLLPGNFEENLSLYIDGEVHNLKYLNLL